jgi:hypothetical protein
MRTAFAPALTCMSKTLGCSASGSSAIFGAAVVVVDIDVDAPSRG